MLLSVIRCRAFLSIAMLVCGAVGVVLAQQPVPSTSPEAQPSLQPPGGAEPPDRTASPGGTVIFSRNDDTAVAAPTVTGLAQVDKAEVTDEERDSEVFTAYDLDVHLTPAMASIETRANLTVRNDGKQPLAVLALQISSSLKWESVAILDSPAANLSTQPKALPVQQAGAAVQQLLETDTDHTGKVREAVLRLVKPLEPGQSVRLTAFYSGTIPLDATRLERIGAPEHEATLADWDQISAQGTALRGFGSVLWYPAVSPPAFLGEGAKLFEVVAKAKLRQQAAEFRLRLTVAYTGDAPDAVFFCNRRQKLEHVSENQDVPVAEAPGIGTVVFKAQPLGFRVPSLFLTDRSATEADDGLLAVVTDHFDALPQYAGAAEKVKPLLTDWLGPQALMPLDILDRDGQAFEDDTLLVRPVRPVRPIGADSLAPQLAHSLAHAWFHSRRIWLDEGVPEFITLLWKEQSQGRDAAVAALAAGTSSLAFIEPAPEPGMESATGQPLINASAEIYYRTKAAAVLWMLRSVVGDDPLRQALTIYRDSRTLDADPMGFERVLEASAHKDLRWLFDDWVYRDRGLPDLSIVSVAPRQISNVAIKATGFLVAVEVRNDGGAIAEVPVTVRSGSLTATEKLRIAPHSSASTRILFQGIPEEVLVNDGSVPELRSSMHRQGLRTTPEAR